MEEQNPLNQPSDKKLKFMDTFEIEEPNQKQVQEQYDSDGEKIQKKNENAPSYKKLFKEMAPLGLLAYGGPMAHIAMLDSLFVEQLKWLKPSQFTELFALCQSLPGPTSTQLVIAIGTLTTSSVRGGLISFLTFSLPAALVLFIFGMVFRYLDSIKFEMDQHVLFAFEGFQSAAIAIVAQAAWKLGWNYGTNHTQLLIMLSSAVIFYLFESPFTMIILMLSGGFLNIFLAKIKDNKEIRFSLSSNKEEEEEGQENVLIQEGKGPFGKISFILFLGFLVGLPLLSWVFGYRWLKYMSSFYYMGSIIIGGGHVILPMILTEFKQFGLSETLFGHGFSIVSALPGPLFNISIYVGALIDGLIGALLGWFTLFLPAFLMIWGILPYWNKYRSIPIIQKGLKGVGAASIGFIIVAVVMLWETASVKDPLTCTLIAISSFVALHIYGCRAPFVVLAGGALMVCRQVVRVQVRGLPADI